MTNEQIERRIERKIDVADACLMTRAITQAEYDRRVREIHRWADSAFAAMREPAQ
jgi:hypothetical protein